MSGINSDKVDDSRLWFWACSLVLLCLYFANFPSATWRAEPFAETASDYFLSALTQRFWENLIKPEFAHVPILPRLITLLGVKLLGLREWYPVFVQCVTATCIAVCSAAISLPKFKQVVPYAPVRAVAAVAIGTHWGWGMYVHHNLGYWAAPLGLLLIWLPLFTPVRRAEGAALLPVLLLLPAKAYSVVFLPFFALKAVLEGRQKHWRSAMLYGLLCVPLLYVIVVNAIQDDLPGTAKQWNTPVGIKNTLVLYWYCLHDVLVGAMIPKEVARYASAMIALTVALFALLMFRRRDRTGMFVIISGHLVAIGTILLTVKAFYPAALPWNAEPTFVDDSHFFYPAMAIFLSTLIAVGRLVSARSALAISVLLSLSSNVFGTFNPKDPYSDPYQVVSNWRVFIKHLNDDAYCIPIHPSGWALRKHCVPLTVQIRIIEGGYIAVDPGRDRVRLIQLNRGSAERLEVKSLQVYKPHTSKLLREVASMTPGPRLVTSFYFSPPIEGAFSLRFLDSQGSQIAVEPAQVSFSGAG